MAAKPSKKQRGKKARKTTNTPGALAPAPSAKTTGLGVSLKPAKSVSHVKFGDDGEAKPIVSVTGKKRGRGANEKQTKDAKKSKDATDDAETTADATGGKSDRSPEMIQSAKYYLEQWKKRNEPTAEGEVPWKFKKIKQQWILWWMFEADVIPKSMFSLVLEYLGGLQGAARQRVLESAHGIIDAGVPDNAEDADADIQDVATRLTRRRYKRALQVAELLS